MSEASARRGIPTPGSEVRRTNLEMPSTLADQIEIEAAADRRTFKQEIVILIEEALAKRRRKPS
jgi:hypothetical protein